MQKKTIGIVGGGQLARMLTLAAKPLGFHVIVVDSKPGCPAAQVGAEEIIAGAGDVKALEQLAKRADYITVEFEEQYDVRLLENVRQPVNPAPSTIELIKDKLKQKQFLRDRDIPLGPFAEITDLKQAIILLERFDGKMVVKTRRGGYDGNGNRVVTNDQELIAALSDFNGRALYAEAFVPFTKELATLIARSIDGSIMVYPVVETIHARNICMETLAPASVSESIRVKAEILAAQVAEHLQGAGVFGIEMFLTPAGEVLLNEIAPRVHNSGHYTIEACQTSQFEQHIRAITGLPLGSTELIVPAAVMVNILGEKDGPTSLEGLDKALATPSTAIHIYGKSPTKVDRKMGHITATGPNVEEARKRARSARKKIKV